MAKIIDIGKGREINRRKSRELFETDFLCYLEKIVEKGMKKEEIVVRNVNKLAAEYKERSDDIEYLFELSEEICESPNEEHVALGLKAMRRALELESDNHNIYSTMSSLYAGNGEYEKAAEFAKTAVDISKDTKSRDLNLGMLASCYNDVAILLEEEGNEERAKEFDELSLKCQEERVTLTNHPNVHLDLAESYEMKGRFADAINIREKVKERLDSFSELSDFKSNLYVENAILLAKDYHTSGEKLKARGIIERLPKSPHYSREALQRLEEIHAIVGILDMSPLY
jgi:tetratricopeptide (TPR) repeat protein